MARKPSAQAAALMEAERADREENADVNEAIARTDSEVFTDAMGDEPLDDEAGTELEDMGEGLEGEELEEDEEEQTPEGEQQATPEGEQAAEGEEGEEDERPDTDGERAGQAPSPDELRARQPSIPPRVLAAQRERYQTQNDELRQQLRDMQVRIDNLSRQPTPQPQPQPAQPQPPQQAPDMFADPEGYRNWVLNEAERRAETRLNERFSQIQQQQQQEAAVRLNDSLAQSASGPRSYEFNVAYRDLTSLDRTPENAALVRRLVANPETAGQAILDWWEQSSSPEYIEYHRDQIRQAYGVAARPQRGGPQRQNGRVPLQNGQVPRHEVRLPRSLSEASGGRSQHVSDPEMMDGAEESIFAYGARR